MLLKEIFWDSCYGKSDVKESYRSVPGLYHDIRIFIVSNIFLRIFFTCLKFHDIGNKLMAMTHTTLLDYWFHHWGKSCHMIHLNENREKKFKTACSVFIDGGYGNAR